MRKKMRRELVELVRRLLAASLGSGRNAEPVLGQASFAF